MAIQTICDKCLKHVSVSILPEILDHRKCPKGSRGPPIVAGPTPTALVSRSVDLAWTLSCFPFAEGQTFMIFLTERSGKVKRFNGVVTGCWGSGPGRARMTC